MRMLGALRLLGTGHQTIDLAVLFAYRLILGAAGDKARRSVGPCRGNGPDARE